MRAAHRGRRLRRTALSASSFPRRNCACAISGPGGNPGKRPHEDWREYTRRLFQQASIRSSIRCSHISEDAKLVACGSSLGSPPARPKPLRRGEGPERELQATSKELVGACAFHRLSSRPEKLRVRNFGEPGPSTLPSPGSWVPGLASGLARDDNPPVALHHSRVPAGSALGGRRAVRVSPSDKQRVGWRVGIPSFVIPAGKIARAQFRRAGTQYTSFAWFLGPGSRKWARPG